MKPGLIKGVRVKILSEKSLIERKIDNNGVDWI